MPLSFVDKLKNMYKKIISNTSPYGSAKVWTSEGWWNTHPHKESEAYKLLNSDGYKGAIAFGEFTNVVMPIFSDILTGYVVYKKVISNTPNKYNNYTGANGTGKTLNADELKKIGNPGDNSGIRHVKGTEIDARKLFDNQVIKSTVKEVQSGVFVGQGQDGFTYTYRAISKSGPPTIDINGVSGLRKIKFLP